jgi:hypothetical protein
MNDEIMELTITTDRSRGWSRSLYVVDEETFARIFQILKENNVTTPETPCPSCGKLGGSHLWSCRTGN